MSEDALYPIKDALALVKQFQEKTLPDYDWTHEAHLVVALYYLSLHTPEAALPIVRKAIRAYNESIGIINSDTSGYHETMTVFWLFYLQKRCATNGKVHFDQDTMDNMLWDETIIGRNVWLEYYSKILMMSTAARRDFVAPDVKALV